MNIAQQSTDLVNAYRLRLNPAIELNEQRTAGALHLWHQTKSLQMVVENYPETANKKPHPDTEVWLYSELIEHRLDNEENEPVVVVSPSGVLINRAWVFGWHERIMELQQRAKDLIGYANVLEYRYNRIPYRQLDKKYADFMREGNEIDNELEELAREVAEIENGLLANHTNPNGNIIN